MQVQPFIFVREPCFMLTNKKEKVLTLSARTYMGQGSALWSG